MNEKYIINISAFEDAKNKLVEQRRLEFSEVDAAPCAFGQECGAIRRYDSCILFNIQPSEGENPRIIYHLAGVSNCIGSSCILEFNNDDISNPLDFQEIKTEILRIARAMPLNEG